MSARVLGERVAGRVHVHAPPRRLIREVYLAIAAHCRRSRAYREARHIAYRAALDAQKEHAELVAHFRL